MTTATTTTPRRRSDRDVASLVRAAAAGDQRSWDGLVREFSGMMWAIARAHRLHHADAADVMQATWIHLLKHIDRLTEPGLVGAWLATTARRECLRVLRRQRDLLIGDDLVIAGMEALASDEPESVDGLLRAERADLLRRALEHLSESDQALLRTLAAEPTPTYQEVSAALAMPRGSIGPTRARALARLRSELDRQNTLSLLAA
jgi:RNA polymerase sigma factor (sigma-70 family)